MTNNYVVTEGAPSATTYMRCGRGGAGNTYRVSSSSASRSSAPSAQAPARRFFSGVGGAGNVHEASERPTVSLDDEVRRLAAQEDQSIGHCGIGGAGNVYRRKASDASSAISDDARSSFSTSSSGAKIWAQVRNSFSHH
ncbi:unnamed protein product [Clonostachys rosea f. rosea IK726]|jgi:hypothetical protein|uniref:Uncharacterized protein n=2 Tax=Bionectria ochroleuca TaxID=29856 RepID=A0A0B7K3K1_BIOOC|nr:unnamed protein product [Clonostachys rosea f. rosea IK726]